MIVIKSQVVLNSVVKWRPWRRHGGISKKRHRIAVAWRVWDGGAMAVVAVMAPHAHPAASLPHPTRTAARARSRDDLRQRRTGTHGGDKLRQRRTCHERRPAARSSRGEDEAVAKKKKTQVFLVLFLLFDTPCFLSAAFFFLLLFDTPF